MSVREFKPSEELRANHAANAGVTEILVFCRGAIADLHRLNEDPLSIEMTQEIRGKIKSFRTLLDGFAPQQKMEKARVPDGPGLNLDNVPYGMKL